MKFFNKEETKVVVGVLLVILVLCLYNFRIAERRARDNERRNDLGDLSTGINRYHAKNGVYPNSLSDLKGYLDSIPKDPKAKDGSFSYLYLTDGSHFQLLASLESSDEAGYDPKIVVRNLKCGNQICNLGKSDGKTPLDKSLSEYENELGKQK